MLTIKGFDSRRKVCYNEKQKEVLPIDGQPKFNYLKRKQPYPHFEVNPFC